MGREVEFSIDRVKWDQEFGQDKHLPIEVMFDKSLKHLVDDIFGSIPDYFAQIGLRYLAIPAMCIAVGTALKNKEVQYHETIK